jgi:hypothetical protein
LSCNAFQPIGLFLIKVRQTIRGEVSIVNVLTADQGNAALSVNGFTATRRRAATNLGAVIA